MVAGTSSKDENLVLKVALPWVIERSVVEYLYISAKGIFALMIWCFPSLSIPTITDLRD
jgi:hypothetical protein